LEFPDIRDDKNIDEMVSSLCAEMAAVDDAIAALENLYRALNSDAFSAARL
jgi:hypothetical protein